MRPNNVVVVVVVVVKFVCIALWGSEIGKYRDTGDGADGLRPWFHVKIKLF